MQVWPLLARFQVLSAEHLREEGLSGSDLRRRRHRSGHGGVSCGAGGEEGGRQDTAYRGGAISFGLAGLRMLSTAKAYRREQLEGVNRWT
jgi:hypothetical protein